MKRGRFFVINSSFAIFALHLIKYYVFQAQKKENVVKKYCVIQNNIVSLHRQTTTTPGPGNGSIK